MSVILLSLAAQEWKMIPIYTCSHYTNTISQFIIYLGMTNKTYTVIISTLFQS